MSQVYPAGPTTDTRPDIRIIRHDVVREKLRLSSAKLFDMIAKGQFPKPFTIVPGGRAVGWLESDVDAWVLGRKGLHASGGEQ
jgi:prophage regulatory protein